jgi:hypothetical protein
MAQTLYSLRQGESKRIVVEIKDSEGNAVDMSVATVIKAEVYIKGSETTRVKYALSPGEGEKALFVNEMVNTSIDIPLDRDESKLLSIGGLWVDVLIQEPSDEMPDGDAVREFAPFKIGNMSKGYLKGTEL